MQAALTDRVRAELERLLPAGDAARVMLSALSAWGPSPPAGVELERFVDGPIQQALGRVVSTDRASALLGSLRAQLQENGLLGSDRPTPVVEIDDRITGRLPLARNRPVPVLVVARSSALSDRLQVLARSERATVAVESTLPGIERAVRGTPLVVVIDATDPPELPAEVIVGALQKTPAHVQWIVWGGARAHGRELAMLAELAQRSAIVIRDDESVGAMVDVILARRA